MPTHFVISSPFLIRYFKQFKLETNLLAQQLEQIHAKTRTTLIERSAVVSHIVLTPTHKYKLNNMNTFSLSHTVYWDGIMIWIWINYPIILWRFTCKLTLKILHVGWTVYKLWWGSYRSTEAILKLQLPTLLDNANSHFIGKPDPQSMRTARRILFLLMVITWFRFYITHRKVNTTCKIGKAYATNWRHTLSKFTFMVFIFPV